MLPAETPEYEVIIDEAALRDIKKLPVKARTAVFELTEKLGTNPRPEGIEPIVRFKGLFRVRSGNYRIVYQIQDNNKLVIVAAVGDRKDIYSLLERRFA